MGVLPLHGGTGTHRGLVTQDCSAFSGQVFTANGSGEAFYTAAPRTFSNSYNAADVLTSNVQY